MNYCFPQLSKQLETLFYSSLSTQRKDIKTELSHTLFNHNEKLNLFANNLFKEIEKEENKPSLIRILKNFFFEEKELQKAKKLLNKISKIQMRGTKGIVLTPNTASALQHLNGLLTESPLTIKVAKGLSTLLPNSSDYKYFITHKGLYFVDTKLGQGGGKKANLIFNATTGKYEVHLKFKNLTEAKKLRHAQCEEQAFLALKGVSRSLKCKEIIQFEGSTSFIVEYANLGSLNDQLADLTEKEREGVALDILKGLAEMHARRLIHRDIKPGNILLIKKDKLIAKIADFDLCLPLTNPIAIEARKFICGTKGFKAPELLNISQIQSTESRRSAILEANTPAIDIFSMGITLYYLFGGKTASKGKKVDPLKKIKQIKQQLKNSSSPIPFASFILSMLSNDPNRRPSAQQAFDYFQKTIERTEDENATHNKTVATIREQTV